MLELLVASSMHEGFRTLSQDLQIYCSAYYVQWGTKTNLCCWWRPNTSRISYWTQVVVKRYLHTEFDLSFICVLNVMFNAFSCTCFCMNSCLSKCQNYSVGVKSLKVLVNWIKIFALGELFFITDRQSEFWNIYKWV